MRYTSFVRVTCALTCTSSQRHAPLVNSLPPKAITTQRTTSCTQQHAFHLHPDPINLRPDRTHLLRPDRLTHLHPDQLTTTPTNPPPPRPTHHHPDQPTSSAPTNPPPPRPTHLRPARVIQPKSLPNLILTRPPPCAVTQRPPFVWPPIAVPLRSAFPFESTFAAAASVSERN